VANKSTYFPRSSHFYKWEWFTSEKELYDFYAEIDKKIFVEKNKPIVRKKFPRKLTKVKK